jgi:predicted Rossmann fold flavoprotein
VARSGIAYNEKTLGQLFCDTSAKEIVAMLLKGVAEAGGQVALNTSVQSVSAIDTGYAIQLSGAQGSRSVTARNLVVACGGKPIPKMGATDFALRLAQQFGIPVTQTYAGLVPFTFSGAQQEAFKSISGVSAPALLQTNGTAFEEAVLFTHRGLSGPAALQVSSYWAPGDLLTLRLLSEECLRQAVRDAKETEGRKSPSSILARLLPARLVPLVLHDLTLPERIADLTAAQLDQLTKRLTQWQLTPAGTEGYRTAEVMVGGVDTAALSSKTMMAKTQPGLYFIGECVDVTGWLGGYNFQWAWSSGWVAGQSIKAGL